MTDDKRTAEPKPPLITFQPIAIGEALLELTRAYERRTRLLAAQYGTEQDLTVEQMEGLHQYLWPEYEFGPQPVNSESD